MDALLIVFLFGCLGAVPPFFLSLLSTLLCLLSFLCFLDSLRSCLIWTLPPRPPFLSAFDLSVYVNITHFNYFQSSLSRNRGLGGTVQINLKAKTTCGPHQRPRVGVEVDRPRAVVGCSSSKSRSAAENVPGTACASMTS